MSKLSDRLRELGTLKLHDDPDAYLGDEAADALDAMESALRECLAEHGGFTIKGEVERKARAALAKLEGK